MFRILSAAVIAVGLSTGAAAATYTDQASFLAANPGLGLVSFEGQVTGLGPSLGTSTSFGGLDFEGENLRIVDTAFWGSVDSLLDDRFGGFISVGNIAGNAVGFFYASNFGDGGSLQFKAFNGVDEVFSTTLFGGGVNTSFAYFGLDGVGDITSIRLSSTTGRDFASIAEISSGVGNGAVPEPATWAMMILGFGLVGAAARRRSTVTA
jgi:hypothetical protein